MAADVDNRSVLCQDCHRPLFRWFLSRIDWRRILKQMPQRADGVPACQTCDGRGEVPTVEYADSMNGYQSAEPCPDCNGTGTAGVTGGQHQTFSPADADGGKP